MLSIATTTLYPATDDNSNGKALLSPRSILTSVFNEASDSIQQILNHSEVLLADFQQKSALIVQQYECDLSNLDQELSKFSLPLPRITTTTNQRSTTMETTAATNTADHALNFHLNRAPNMDSMEFFTLPAEDDRDKKDDGTDKSSTISYVTDTNSNKEQKHYSREKMLCALTYMKNNEMKLHEQLQQHSSILDASGRRDEFNNNECWSTSAKQSQELQLALEQCQRKNCETIATMIDAYKPRYSKSRMQSSNLEKKLKGLGYKFPSIESISRGTEIQDISGISDIIPKLVTAIENKEDEDSNSDRQERIKSLSTSYDSYVSRLAIDRINFNNVLERRSCSPVPNIAERMTGFSCPDDSANEDDYDYWEKEDQENNRTESLSYEDDFDPYAGPVD